MLGLRCSLKAHTKDQPFKTQYEEMTTFPHATLTLTQQPLSHNTHPQIVM